MSESDALDRESDHDFEIAAARHFHDGDLLHNSACYPTATHLYGLAAECALKQYLRKLPNKNVKIPWDHIPHIANSVARQINKKKDKKLYDLVTNKNYFIAWQVSDRYLPDSYFNTENCQLYRKQAQRTLAQTGVKRNAR